VPETTLHIEELLAQYENGSCLRHLKHKHGWKKRGIWGKTYKNHMNSLPSLLCIREAEKSSLMFAYDSESKICYLLKLINNRNHRGIL
jgi:hypothetical protein